MPTQTNEKTTVISVNPNEQIGIEKVDRAYTNDSGVVMGTTLNDFNAVTKDDVIKADHLLKAANVLGYLRSHYHAFYDDYTAVCQCVCQCLCNRGTL